jgi:hypothetical protein
MNTRALLKELTVAILAALFWTLSAFAQEPVRLESGVSGHIHPALCRTKKGTLVAVFCKSEYKPYLITRSTDGGKSWSAPTPFPHTVSTQVYPGSLTTLSDGRLLHAWNVWFAPTEGVKSRYVAFSLSSDDGVTWSEPKALNKNADPKVHSVIRHPILELSPKSWLFPLADRTILFNPDTGEETPFADGANHGLVPIVRTSAGTIVSGKGKRSTDGGKTWQDIKPFPDVFTQGWRHQMVALQNGWLLASQVVGPGVGGDIINYIISRDDGQTWDLEHPVEFYNPGRPIGGRACPRSVELDAQTLGTIYYDVDDKQPGGSGVFFRTMPLTKLAPPSAAAASSSSSASVVLPVIQSAASDEKGRIVVNGKPLFPILLYDAPADPESLRKFHDHGFNVITVAKTEDAEAARQAGLYAAAHSKKITNLDSVLLGIGIDSPVLNLKPPLLENLKADLDKTRAAIPNRPVMHAIGYWLDEPKGVITNVLPPAEKYEEVVQAIDVSAPYLYPVPYQPIQSVGEAVARAANASGGKKPVLPVLQIFAWTATDRYPTAAELKCMVYLALIHGARGIGYYSYSHVTGKKGVTFAEEKPEVWDSLRSVNAELAQIGPFVLDAETDPAVTLKETGLECRAFSSGARHLVLLANPSDSPRESVLAFASVGEMRLRSIGGGADVVVRGGVAMVKIEANGAMAFQY